MPVDSFPRVSEHGAKNSLHIDQAGGDGTKPTQSSAVGYRFVLGFDAPVGRGKNSQTNRQGKKSLRKRSVNERQCVLKQNDPQPANDSLENHQQQCRDSKPAQPMTALTEPERYGQCDRQQPDG